MADVRISVLGPFRVHVDGDEIDPGPPLQRLVLAALVVARGQPLSSDRLAELLWDAPPARARHSLQQYVSRLRRLLGADAIATTSAGYALSLPGTAVDAWRWSELLDRMATTEDPAVGIWRDAETCWTGRPYAGLPERPFLVRAVRDLDDRRGRVAEVVMGARIEQGGGADAVEDLRVLVDTYPLREGLGAQLVTALAGAGRRAEALVAHREARARIVDATGLEPGSALAAAQAAVLREDDAMPGATEHVRRARPPVPKPRTPLVGRDGHLRAVRDLLGAHPLVTLVGPGGVGKTRLALQVVHGDVGDREVRWAALDDVLDRTGVAARLAHAFDVEVPAGVGAVDVVAHAIGSDRVALVLDNCEQAVEGVAEVVDRLLDRCRGLRVLATSRHPLGVPGERVHRLRGLPTDDAAALFLDRARAHGLEHDVGPDELVAEIVEALDGLPLAVELAAARTSHLSLQDIRDHLDERLWLLRDDNSSGRHRSMASALDWSHDLLTARERHVLFSLAVTSGTADAGLVADVAALDPARVVDTLAGLVRGSLVVPVTDDGRSRYRLLQTVQSHALARAAQTDRLDGMRTCHAHVVLRGHEGRGVLEDMGHWGVGKRPPSPEIDVALAFLAEAGRAADVGVLAGRVLTTSGQTGWVDPLRRHLEREDVLEALQDRGDRARYLTASAMNASVLGDRAAQHRWAVEAVDAADDPGTKALALALLANSGLRVPGVDVGACVRSGLDLAPPTASRLRRFLRDQGVNASIAAERFDEALPVMQELAAVSDYHAGMLMVVLALVGRGDELEDVVLPRGDEVSVWGHLPAVARTMRAAATGDDATARRHLSDAARTVEGSAHGFLDATWADVLVAAAVAALHRGEIDRAVSNLGVTQGRTRCPATYAVYLDVRRRLVDLTDRAHRRALVARAREQSARDTGRRLLDGAD